MNISAISFKGIQDDNIDIPEWVNRNHPQSRRTVNSHLERAPQRDIYSASQRRSDTSSGVTRRHSQGRGTVNSHLEEEPLQRDTYSNTQRKNSSHKKSGIPGYLKILVAGLGAAFAINHAAVNINQSQYVVDIPVDSSSSLEDIADLYGSDIDAILSYNDLAVDADLSSVGSVSVPASYDYLQDIIDEMQDKLYDKNLSDEEREQIEEQLAKYKDKQVLQKSIAAVYTDGRYVYYTITDIPENINPSGTGRINVETFKDIFDIEDGALKKYNDIDFVWAYDEDSSEYEKGYRDYTVGTLKIGDTVKVRMNDIQLDD